MNKVIGILAALSILLTTSLPMFAHHSAAAYNTQQDIKVTGTVKQYSYKNPHVYLVVDVKKDDGSVVAMEVEAGAPAVLNPLGFTKDSVKVGDLVTIVGNPHRTSDRSILGTLAHVFAADRVWFDRVIGHQRAAFIEDRDRDLKVLYDEWPKLHTAWREWLASYSRDLNNDSIAYTSLKGDPFTSTATEVILHVVNHGTHHRGQVSGFLRMLGHTPPPLDLIAFYRSQ